MGLVLPANHSRLDNASTAELTNRYQSGESLSELSRDTGLSAQAISNRLKGAGVEIDSKPQKLDIDPVLVRSLYVDQRLTGLQIAEHIGCERTTVYDILEAAGVERRNEYWHSTAENEIRAVLESATGKPFPSANKWGRQLDLYNDELKLAVEYCGLYWHCEYHKTYHDRQRHVSKFKLCRENGIRLITVFEDEWISRREIVTSVLLGKAGVFQRRIGARKCKLVEVERQKAIDFVNRWHLQGAKGIAVTRAIGLEHNGELLATMLLGPHHRSGTDALVLSRLCFAGGVQIVGGATKLLAAVKERPILSWSDNRWSDGGVYRTLGFELDGELPTDYSYVDLKSKVPKRVSKQSRKKKEPSELTERELAIRDRLFRIWDCGKYRWVLW